MKMKYSIYIIVYTFFFIYFPPLLSFNILHLLTLYSLVSLIIFYKNTYSKLIINTLMPQFISLLIIAILYLLLVLLISQNNIIQAYPYLLISIEIPICIIYLCSYFIKHRYSIYDVLNVLLIVGTIQGLIAVLSFFIPAFKDILVNIFANRIIAENANDEIIYQLASVRLNGLSTNLTFTTPVVQSLLGLISLYLALNKNYRYILFMPLLVFSAIINARNSFIVLMYGLILLILMSKKTTKTVLKLLVTAITITIIIPVLVESISDSSELVFSWISIGFNEIIAFFQGENTGYFETVTTDFIRFPDGLSIIFGTGSRIFGLDIGKGSDIGYINDIWLGGLFFASINYFVFLSYYIKAYKNADNLIRFIVLLFISTFLILNVKGTIVSNNDFINISILLSAVFILNKKDKSFNADKIEIKQNQSS